MQLVLDNIAAIMITSTVLLILMGVMVRNQQAQVEAAGYYALKTKALGFIDMLERDIQNADSVITTGMEVGGANNSFAFYSQFDSTSTTAYCVRYELAPTEVRTKDADSLQLYQIRRYQGPRVAGCPLNQLSSAGASPATVTDWSVAPINDSDQPVTDPAKLSDTRAVAIQFSIWSPFEVSAEAYVKETTWSLTFRPPLMQRGGATYL